MSSSGTYCAECTRRWRELAAATRTHVELLKQQERLALSDPARFRCEIQAAAERRDAARIAVKTHLAVDHPEQAETAAT